MGDPADLANESWTDDPRIELHEFRAGIFSLAGQFSRMSRPRNGLLWVPHFNAPMLFSGKLLVTIHDVCPLAHPETLANGLHRFYARRLFDSAANRAAAILCNSEFTAREVQNFLGVDRSRLVVTYPCITELPDGAISSPSEADNPPYLLAVGNVKRHKNLGRLIAAYDRVKDRIPHTLMIVGKKAGFLNPDGDLSGVSSLLEGRVRFTGHVSEGELGAFYKSADALIFPSLYEGFGYPVVEAMAKGCPVACSNASCLPEITGDAALLFDPFNLDDIAEAIMTIVSDGHLRATLRERGWKRIQRFERDESIGRTANVINELLTSSSASFPVRTGNSPTSTS
ncbi:MAG: glycosyltransferase family 4 protein [Acidobacteriota bacterium]